ncbi:MAG: lysylphosphatidylglycerol synthase transmembrane domain-containing protein [Acidobacteriota bacterium]
MRRAITLISGPVLAIFFLWLAFRNVDPDALLVRIRAASIPLLAASLVTVVLHLLLRAQRWKTFLTPVRRALPFGELLSAVSIGYMASLLPGRVGEVLRPALLARRTGIPFAPALATVGVERVVFDLLGLLFFMGVGLLMPATLSGLDRIQDSRLLTTLHAAGVLATLLAAALLVGFVWAARHQARASTGMARWAERCRTKVGRRLVTWLGSLAPGLGALATPMGVLRLLLETVVIWGVIAAGIQLGVEACGVDLAPGAALILMPMLALGIAVPTPGGAGSYHAVMIAGLTKLFGAPPDAAASAALVVHAATWIPVLAMGGYFAARGGLAAPVATIPSSAQS